MPSSFYGADVGGLLLEFASFWEPFPRLFLLPIRPFFADYAAANAVVNTVVNTAANTGRLRC